MAQELEQLAQAAVFLAALWLAGRLFSLAYAQLIGEILAGMLLGSELLNWLPFEDAITLVGQVGLVLLVMEGGLSVSLDALRRVGLKASAIAVVGTVLPVLLGYALMTAFGMGGLEGLAAGTSLSSTSIGMAVRMLKSMGELDTPLGNLIAVAAMVDDVLSLVILAVLQQLNASTTDETNGEVAWRITKPIVVSVIVVLGSLPLVRGMPGLCQRAFKRLSGEQRDRAVIGSLLVLTALLTIGAGYAGSTYLLGAFAAGMAFTLVPKSQELWVEYEVLNGWLTSIFFASIGFVIPISELFEPESLGLGLLYAVPAVGGKYVTGFLACDRSISSVVGWAMVGRGELGFVIAREAREGDDPLLSPRGFLICVWALLVATFMSPILLRFLLARRNRAAAAEEAGAAGDAVIATEGLGSDAAGDPLQPVSTVL